MLYHQKPHIFPTQMQVSAGILEYHGQILLLKRAENCSSAGLWCEPGGKRESSESSEEALEREIFEETGIDISQEKKNFLCTKYFYFLEHYIEIDFYRVILSQLPRAKLNNEHTDFIWIKPEEALKMDLVEDFNVILKEIYWLIY